MTVGRIRFCSLLLCMIVLAGCRQAGNRPPTAQPTQIPTPRSTPLPAIDPTIAPGADDNPLRLVIAADSSVTRTASAADDLAETLSETSGLNVMIELVPTTADAVAALCGSFDGRPAAVWVDGLGLAAARLCGTPTLWIEREAGRDTTTADTLQWIVPEDGDITAISGLAGEDVCRVSALDYATWRAPLLLLHANGVDPASLGSVTDLPTIEAVIEAVAAGDCAAGITARDFDDLAEGSVRTAIRTLPGTYDLPHAVLMYPLEIPLGARLTLNEAIIAAGGSAQAERLLEAADIRPLAEDDLTSYFDFIESTGLLFERPET